MTVHRRSVLLLIVLLAACRGQDAGAQSFKRGGTEFNALREVAVPPGKAYTVLVTEFFAHGELLPDGRNLLVSTHAQQLVPCRLLQVGPGDFCRVALQTVGGVREYEILYGGVPVPEKTIPVWSNRDGLLMETRQYKSCNPQKLEELIAAFNSAKPIGADYVESVFHSHNPFSLAPGPFLTRYSGFMNITNAGKYAFFTGAVDCGYFLLDEKLVTSRRGMLHQVRPESRSEVHLTAGLHPFEYYHAATGSNAMIATAWEVHPKGDKPAPMAITSDVWRTNLIGHVPCAPVIGREVRMPPDFLVRIEGHAPLPDNDVPLVRVFFKNTTPKALTTKARVTWDFGDGQIAEQEDATHVYLRPGLYTVKLTVARPQKSVETVNRLYVDQPFESRFTKVHVLDDYLPQILTYNPRTLDAASLRQLVSALEAKAAAIEAPPEPEDRPQTDTPPPAVTPQMIAARRVEATKLIGQAVETGKVAFIGASAASGDDNLIKLARLVSAMARDRVGNAQLAYDIWCGAYQRIRNPEFKAECAGQAADVALNDLLKPALAKPLLADAVKVYDGSKTGTVAGLVRRVSGDYAAVTGDGKTARKAYLEAEKLRNSNRNRIEQTAWRGAHNRSVEDYIKTQQYDRAIAEIREWQQDYPTEKIDGQITVMYANYWAGRQMYDQVTALSEQLLAVNPDSPYVDQLLMLAANCETRRNQAAKALALLHALVKDYPGSPLVPSAKESIARLERSGGESRKTQSGSK